MDTRCWTRCFVWSRSRASWHRTRVVFDCSDGRPCAAGRGPSFASDPSCDGVSEPRARASLFADGMQHGRHGRPTRPGPASAMHHMAGLGRPRPRPQRTAAAAQLQRAGPQLQRAGRAAEQRWSTRGDGDGRRGRVPPVIASYQTCSILRKRNSNNNIFS